MTAEDRATSSVARETLDIVRRGSYSVGGRIVDLREAIASAVAGTRLYTPEELERMAEAATESAAGGPPAFELTSETTAEAARRLYREGSDRTLALNFASARNPGGGFLRGAKAQEEDLARCSALYECQLTQPRYYDVNRAQASLLYSDHLIYSPAVPFFRDERLELLPEPFFASIVTSPAPNAGEVLSREPSAEPQVQATLKRRAGHILFVARERGYRSLVLGAWGCGVFRNSPARVSQVFHDHLQSRMFRGAFERVVFAIYETNPERPNLAAFRAQFSA